MLQEAKALPLTQKDREVIEYFFNHFELDGFIIHGPVKEMSAEERLSHREEERTTLDLAKTVKDTQLGPVKVTVQFSKKEPSEGKLVKEENDREFKSYAMRDDTENKVVLPQFVGFRRQFVEIRKVIQKPVHGFPKLIFPGPWQRASLDFGDENGRYHGQNRVEGQHDQRDRNNKEQFSRPQTFGLDELEFLGFFTNALCPAFVPLLEQLGAGFHIIL